MRFALCVVLLSVVGLAGCGDDRPRGAGGRGVPDAGFMGGDAGSARCGNGIREGSEACDGADLGGQSCEGLGLGGGALTCTESCTLDASGCEVSCTPDCGERQCGFDPACPTSSCGTCEVGSCSSEGFCDGGSEGPTVTSLLTEGPSLLSPGGVLGLVAQAEPGATAITFGQLELVEGDSGWITDFESLGDRYIAQVTVDSLADAGAFLEAPVGGMGVTVRARFFDDAGLESTRDLVIQVGCAETEMCGTVCADLNSDPSHCGACGASCEGSCTSGTCGSGGTGTVVYIYEGNCSAGCAAEGMACNPASSLTSADAPDECVGFANCFYDFDTSTGMSVSCGTSIPPFVEMEGICSCSGI